MFWAYSVLSCLDARRREMDHTWLGSRITYTSTSTSTTPASSTIAVFEMESAQVCHFVSHCNELAKIGTCSSAYSMKKEAVHEAHLLRGSVRLLGWLWRDQRRVNLRGHQKPAKDQRRPQHPQSANTAALRSIPKRARQAQTYAS